MARALHCCPLCGSADQRVVYEGRIRNGRFGSLTPEAHRVMECGGCGTARLQDPPAIDYHADEYRTLVDGSADSESFYRLHDAEQPAKLALLGMEAVRGRGVADIGCGAGAFLDVVRGVAAQTVAVEPATAYHDLLRSRGHAVFPDTSKAADAMGGTLDTAVCFSVIEHVADPPELLSQIRRMLRPGGELLLSTPNARDWLLELLPEHYPAFFYRSVHRWYFTAEAIEQLASACGFAEVSIRFVHRYDLANLMLWLRDRRPSGLNGLPIPPAVNAAYREFVEEAGRSDYIYARLRA